VRADRGRIGIGRPEGDVEAVAVERHERGGFDRRRLVVAGAVDVSRGIIRRSSPWQLASLFWCAKNG
jgi:hypothetical protein